MKVAIEYLVDGREIRETVELKCADDKPSIDRAVITYVQNRGCKHFPRYRVEV